MNYVNKFYCVCFFIFMLCGKSTCFSEDYVLKFKIDMRNPEYDNLYCSDLPLCDEYGTFCDTYNPNLFNDPDLNEYCYILKKKCYTSEKCCTGKTGCCNARCPIRDNKESFIIVIINFGGLILSVGELWYLWQISMGKKQS